MSIVVYMHVYLYTFTPILQYLMTSVPSDWHATLYCRITRPPWVEAHLCFHISHSFITEGSANLMVELHEQMFAEFANQ